MALTGKKAGNSWFAEGISWQDRYNISSSQSDDLQNVIRVVGVDTSGSQSERAVIWQVGETATDYFDSASFGTNWPQGTVVFDMTQKMILMYSGSTGTGKAWFTASLV